MKLAKTLVPLFLSAFLLQCGRKPINPSIKDLADNPGSWNGKEIALEGYVIITEEFERSPRIWESKQDAEKREIAPFVKIVGLSPSYSRKDWKSPYVGLVRVLGVFEYAEYDHVAKLHLDQVKDVKWLNPKE